MSKRDAQADLDNEEAAQLLGRILRLRYVKDQVQENVTRLTRELAAEKRRLKEAGWNLAAAEQSARERLNRKKGG